jgi:hypothetical protein
MVHLQPFQKLSKLGTQALICYNAARIDCVASPTRRNIKSNEKSSAGDVLFVRDVSMETAAVETSLENCRARSFRRLARDHMDFRKIFGMAGGWMDLRLDVHKVSVHEGGRNGEQRSKCLPDSDP